MKLKKGIRVLSMLLALLLETLIHYYVYSDRS